MTRTLRITTLILFLLCIIALPVLAASYSATYTVTNNSTTASYSMLPVIGTANNTYLAANGFINSTANDTRIETSGGLEKPWMVADVRTLTAIPVGISSQTNLSFTTGNSEADAMNIITGYGGYITTTDSATLEPSANFTLEYSGWVNTDNASGMDIAVKTNAIRLAVSENVSGNVTATIGAYYNIDQELQNGVDNVGFSSAFIRAGERFTAFPGATIASVSFYLQRVAAPVGTANITVRDAATDTLLGIIGTQDVALLGAGLTFVTYSTTPVSTPVADIRVAFEYTGAWDGVNYVNVGRQGADVIPNGNAFYYGLGAYTEIGGMDSTIKMTANALELTAIGVTSAEHEFVVSSNSTWVALSVDGVTSDNKTLAFAVPNNANNWVLLKSAVTPYANYIALSRGGNEVLRYAPTTIVNGTTMPDRTTPAEDGVITWGANPAGVQVAIGSMVSAAQPIPGQTTTGTSPDILPETPVSDPFVDPEVGGALLTNPLRPFVRILVTATGNGMSESQAWVYLGFVFVILVTVGTASQVRGHWILAGIACAGAIIALVTQTIWPLWTVTFAIVAIIGGAVAERSPSL